MDILCDTVGISGWPSGGILFNLGEMDNYTVDIPIAEPEYELMLPSTTIIFILYPFF